jgi:hypothetical protein
MPRVTVTIDAVGGQDGKVPVLFDEQVHGVDLEDEHASVQFLERFAWAIEDGEWLERAAYPAAATTARGLSASIARSPGIRSVL